MRVAVDVRTMQESLRGGIGRSLSNLLPLLAAKAELHLLTDRGLAPLVTELPQVPLRMPFRPVSASWLQLSAPLWLRGFDGAFHCPFYALPHWLPVPGVASLHDLTFEHFPTMFSRRHTVSFQVQARRAARCAGCLITGTEFVRQDIIETYGVSPDRVLVSPQSVDPVFVPDLDPSAVLERLGVARPYVVALGGAPRRNLDLAVAAHQAVLADGADVDLVVVGPESTGPAPGVHWAGPLADPDWAALLSGAHAFLYPTLYEGFGMPGLEALAAGTPVVAARVGSLPEVLGETAMWSDSLAVQDLANALSDLLLDATDRERRRQLGLDRVKAWPGWQHAADVHLDAYARAASW